MAEFERSLIVERTSAGRIVAKARYVRFGLSPALPAEQITHARHLINEEKKPVVEVGPAPEGASRDPLPHAKIVWRGVQPRLVMHG